MDPFSSKGNHVHVSPEILPTPYAIGEVVADSIVERAGAASERPFLLGCPSGRTAVPVYEALARRAREGHDLSNLVIVMMDDYLVPDTEQGYRVVDPAASYSCWGFARRDILEPIARACAQAGTTAPTHIWTADPQRPEEYDERIAQAGGIDLFLLASGDSDGHVAFNQPGTPRGTGTHIAQLGEATRRDNMGTFPEFTQLDMVPRHGVTVGVDTIARYSAAVVMILTGAHKHQAFERITAADAYDSQWPATIITECRNPVLFADTAAAGTAGYAREGAS